MLGRCSLYTFSTCVLLLVFCCCRLDLVSLGKKTLELKSEFCKSNCSSSNNFVVYTGFLYSATSAEYDFWQLLPYLLPLTNQIGFLNLGCPYLPSAQRTCRFFDVSVDIVRKIKRAKQCEAQRGTVKSESLIFPYSWSALLQPNVID